MRPNEHARGGVAVKAVDHGKEAHHDQRVDEERHRREDDRDQQDLRIDELPHPPAGEATGQAREGHGDDNAADVEQRLDRRCVVDAGDALALLLAVGKRHQRRHGVDEDGLRRAHGKIGHQYADDRKIHGLVLRKKDGHRAADGANGDEEQRPGEIPRHSHIVAYGCIPSPEDKNQAYGNDDPRIRLHPFALHVAIAPLYVESSPGVASYLQLMKAPQDMTKAARAVRAATILVFIEI